MAIDNLTGTAIAEFDAIVEGGHAYGPDAAERTLLRFTTLFGEIARGHGLGHTRMDLGFPPFIRFRHLRPLPFTVVYDERTNIVLRIIGARGLHEHMALSDFDRG